VLGVAQVLREFYVMSTKKCAGLPAGVTAMAAAGSQKRAAGFGCWFGVHQREIRFADGRLSSNLAVGFVDFRGQYTTPGNNCHRQFW